MDMLAGIVGGLFGLAFFVAYFGFCIYLLVLTVKFLRRGIKAFDKYLAEDNNNSNQF
ncbi:hypothetical protein [Vallitalea okinawensis]|uniref:hypothetical protein n=1 Tax=Vallitalea okinawensis TaxID=2078660 RepID=UPI0013004132|nr:hypothetical protein [Vallitalea okinawensis]